MAIMLDISESLPRKVDVVVLGYNGSVVGAPKAVAKAWSSQKVDPDALAVDLGAKSDLGTLAWLPGTGSSRVLLVGLGSEPTPADLRTATATAVMALRDANVSSVALSFGVQEPEEVRCIAEAALVEARAPHTLATSDAPDEITDITVIAAAGRDLVAESQAVANAIVQVREWVNLPANLLYPETFADQAKRSTQGTKVTAEIIDDAALAKGGFGGLMAVGGGSSRGPRLVKLSYAPRGATTHLALVGKGITFDSGGLDLKPADAMYTMRCDMAGAATVLGTIRAIADLGLKIKVTAWAPMAENMPSGTAFRPSDVLTMYGGTTVENANTDAEGRLVLADALARASEDTPDVVVDVATLTGACMVALGSTTAGLFSDDDEFAEQFLGAAESASELLWRLPVSEEAKKALKSQVADLRSSGTSRYGGASVAAAFLRRFVPEEITWAHMDIAGTAFRDSGDASHPAGATGYGVRTLVELARSLAS